MEKRSVQLLWFASIFLLPIGCSAENNARPILKQADLERPEAVVAALKSGVSKEAKAMAETFFTEGTKAREQANQGKRSWGPVAKSFGESALYYPRPLALMGDAEAVLRDIGGANKPEQVRKSVLEGALNEYKSAIAADDFLKELTSQQRNELNHYRECIARYLDVKAISAACDPIKWVGLK